MIFIHGGGFVLGSNKSDGQGPHFLMTADIVLVVTNYRLGLLGTYGLGEFRRVVIYLNRFFTFPLFLYYNDDEY